MDVSTAKVLVILDQQKLRKGYINLDLNTFAGIWSVDISSISANHSLMKLAVMQVSGEGQSSSWTSWLAHRNVEETSVEPTTTRVRVEIWYTPKMVVGIGTMTMRNRWIEGQIILDKPIKLKADIRGDYKNEHGENHICWRLVCDKSQFRLLGRHCRWSLKPCSRWKKKQKRQSLQETEIVGQEASWQWVFSCKGTHQFAPGFLLGPLTFSWHTRGVDFNWRASCFTLERKLEVGHFSFFSSRCRQYLAFCPFCLGRFYKHVGIGF